MKVKSDRLPQNDFEINNIQGNNCDVVFFNIKNYLEEQDENNNPSYTYESYTIKTIYRPNLNSDISANFEKWYNSAVESEKESLAAQIRAKRDQLLEETDKEMAIDRLGINFPSFNLSEKLSLTNITSYFKDLVNAFKTLTDELSKITSSDMADYRQKLRDITKQDGFPFNVEFPIAPGKEDK